MLYDTDGNEIHANIGNRGLTDEQVVRILDYLQGAVYCWCKNRPNEEFGAQLLFGEENSDWNGTPLQDCYYHREASGTPDPVKEAAKDCGHLLRRMLQDDNRSFKQTSTTFPGQHYVWMPDDE